MTGVSYSGATPWSAKLAAWWGHRSSTLLIASVLGAIALRLRPLPAGSVISLMAPIALMTLVVTSWLLMRQHDRRLCEACMKTMPLDAAAVAARRKRRFQVTHLGSNKPLVAGYLIVLVGSAFVPGTVGLIVWTIAQASMIYLVLSYSSHRKLQPWCPWCSDGGGGHRDDVDAPDPVPQGYQPA